MKKFQIVFPCILLMFSLIGCAIDLSQPEVATPVNAPSPSAAESGFNLNGQIVYSTASAQNDVFTSKIQMLDLATSETQTVFTVVGNAWIYYLAVAPDEKQLIMSYAPPFQPGDESGTGLYRLPLDGSSAPQILFALPTISDRYLQVEWSPDGKYIYFVHYNLRTQSSEEIFPHYEIFRMAYPAGQPEKILDHAFYPRISADSSQLLYVSLDPISGTNQLFTANVDGSNPQEIKLLDHHSIIDAPIFSPDGQAVIFSAASPSQTYQPNWLDRLMGVQVVHAHNVPSDWWSVPISGGTSTRLTQLQTTKLFASISPDKKHIASSSADGIFVMQPDGSNLIQVVSDPGISSTLNWIP
ncbi:MAG: hypothetical protein ABI904_01995 [Chloroflexota bacterium]